MNFDDTPGEFFISTDKTLLDAPFIHRELCQTYWGYWMTMPTVLKAIDNSLCFGLYQRHNGKNRQIGFARVITDYATFAWLCDVFVTQAFRKKALGKFIVNTVTQHPHVRCRSIMLSTKDAEKLYQGFGFTNFMAMKRQGVST